GRAMSKSLGNGADVGEQLAAHGVDAIRLTMIFASPPADDIDWADVRPEASVKFLGRAWRIASEAGAASAPSVTDSKAGGASAPSVTDSEAGAASAPCVTDGASAPATGNLELGKVTHRTIDGGTSLVESRRLNVAVARLMELTTAARRAIDSGPGAADPAVREAAETLAVLLSLFAPYTAEECWELLGHQGSVTTAGWPSADPGLLVQDLVTCVGPGGGKVRDRLEGPPGVRED